MPKTDPEGLRIKSGGRALSKHPLVIIGVGLVIIMGLVMVVGLVIPPWANPDRGLFAGLKLPSYVPTRAERTAPALVGVAGNLEPSWQPNANSSSQGDGIAYVGHGCASCHGLDAQGGVVGGPLAGLDRYLIQSFVRIGPQGMPSYSEAELSDEGLEAIADWLSTLETATATRSPTPTAEGPPLIPHTLDGRTDCLMCHGEGIAGAPQIPPDHEGRTNAMCSACHQKG